MNYTDLDKDIKLHRHGNNVPVSYRVSLELLSFLDSITKKSHTTLETGAGISTLFFAMKETKHHCIAPDAALFERIKDYCKQEKINHKNIKFYSEPSQYLLPTLKEKIDIALIDGDHAFPAPFLDWYYLEPNLKIGGYLIVDDTQLWTGKTLLDFLNNEPEWELVKIINAETAIFKKLKDGSQSKWWGQQPYVVKKSYIWQIITKLRQLSGLV